MGSVADIPVLIYCGLWWPSKGTLERWKQVHSVHLSTLAPFHQTRSISVLMGACKAEARPLKRLNILWMRLNTGLTRICKVSLQYLPRVKRKRMQEVFLWARDSLGICQRPGTHGNVMYESLSVGQGMLKAGFPAIPFNGSMLAFRIYTGRLKSWCWKMKNLLKVRYWHPGGSQRLKVERADEAPARKMSTMKLFHGKSACNPALLFLTILTANLLN